MDAIPGRITRRDNRGTEFRDVLGRRWVFPPAPLLGRFRDPQHLPGYGQAAGLKCFMFPVAGVYATTREEAEAFADANNLRGPVAQDDLAALEMDMAWLS